MSNNVTVLSKMCSHKWFDLIDQCKLCQSDLIRPNLSAVPIIGSQAMNSVWWRHWSANLPSTDVQIHCQSFPSIFHLERSLPFASSRWQDYCKFRQPESPTLSMLSHVVIIFFFLPFAFIFGFIYGFIYCLGLKGVKTSAKSYPKLCTYLLEIKIE